MGSFSKIWDNPIVNVSDTVVPTSVFPASFIGFSFSNFAVHLVAAELAAGGADLAAQTAADGGVDAEAFQLLLEAPDVGTRYPWKPRPRWA